MSKQSRFVISIFAVGLFMALAPLAYAASGTIEKDCDEVHFFGDVAAGEMVRLAVRLHDTAIWQSPRIQDDVVLLSSPGPFDVTVPWVDDPSGRLNRTAISVSTDGGSAWTNVAINEDFLDCPPEPPGTGRFTGGGHQIRVDGVRVTRGLTVHCDLLLSNNLEVNWGGNSFHMTNHLVTVECSDDPNIDQFPPAAPLDTLIGEGTGRFNGQDGFSIEFTLVDAGEPGRDDMSSLLIYETSSGNVVLDVPLQLIDGGNLQAHFDQPHK